MKQQVTIKDVAKHAATSVGTVSNVLNGLRCSQKLRERIDNAIAELNYTPNMHAKAVRSNRTNCIGILVESRAQNDAPWLQSLILDSIKTISSYNYRNMIEYWDTQSQFMPQMLSCIDGLITIGNYSESFFEALEKKYSFPIVTYWEKMPHKKGISLPVNIDNGMRKGIEHLLLLGHSKIGFIGSSTCTVNKNKITAFCNALKMYGHDQAESRMVFIEEHKDNHSHSDAGFEATHNLLDKNPDITAIFYSSDCYALGGIGALAASGLKIPQDISVMSYDNSYWAENTRPGITSIGFHSPLVPSMVELLLKMIDSTDISTIKSQVNPAELDIFIRNSTAKKRTYDTIKID